MTTRLDILNPTRVMPMRDPADGSVWYQIMLDDGKPYIVPGYMLLNMRHMSANGEKASAPSTCCARAWTMTPR